MTTRRSANVPAGFTGCGIAAEAQCASAVSPEVNRKVGATT